MGSLLSIAVLAGAYGLMRVSSGGSRPQASLESARMRPAPIALAAAFSRLEIAPAPVSSAPGWANAPGGAGVAAAVATPPDLALELAPFDPGPSEPAPAATAPVEATARPGPPPAPVPQTRATSPAPPAPAKLAAAGAYSVQLVAVRSAEAAESAWGAVSRENGDLVGALSPRVVRADLGARGIVYRLQAGPLASADEARRLCASLEARGQGCFIVAN